MKSRHHAVVALTAFLLSSMALAEVEAQEVDFTHGGAEGGRVKTNRATAAFTESTDYAQLGSSDLTVEVQPGDSDLFIFEFDAECKVFGGPDDWLSVQARLNGAIGVFGGSFLQPQGNPTDLALCTGSEGSHAVSKSWAVRLSNPGSSPISRTFSIWVRVFDPAPDDGPASAFLDNRTVRITRYN